eukprot:Skav228867  [mRNA]  locus=scaffold816:268566:269141:- [translate_table: standard]
MSDSAAVTGSMKVSPVDCEDPESTRRGSKQSEPEVRHKNGASPPESVPPLLSILPGNPSPTPAPVLDRSIASYLLTRQTKRSSRWVQVLWVLSSILAMMLLLVFAPLLVPFNRLEDGFWGNLKFNLLTHPVLNYLIGRIFVEIVARYFSPQERKRVHWIVASRLGVGRGRLQLCHIENPSQKLLDDYSCLV